MGIEINCVSEIIFNWIIRRFSNHYITNFIQELLNMGGAIIYCNYKLSLFDRNSIFIALF